MEILLKDTRGVTPRVEKKLRETLSPAAAALSRTVVVRGDQARRRMGWQEVGEGEMLSLARRGCPVWCKISGRTTRARCFANTSLISPDPAAFSEALSAVLEYRQQQSLALLLHSASPEKLASLTPQVRVKLLSHPSQEVRMSAILALGRAAEVPVAP